MQRSFRPTIFFTFHPLKSGVQQKKLSFLTMPRRPKSTSNAKTWAATRSTVVFLRLEEGWSSAKIMRRTGCPERTVRRWVQQFQEDGRVENLKRGPQNPTKRTAQTIRFIKVYMKGKKGRSIKDCQDYLARKNLQLSQETIRMILKQDLGLYPYRKQRRPKLLLRHKEARLAYVKANMDRDWTDVAFSDEKRFSMEPKPNRKNDVIWDDSPDDEAHYDERSKYGGKSCEVWGCITYWGKPKLYFIERPLVTASDGKKYKKKFLAKAYRDKILCTAVPQLDSIFSEQGIENWWFQQDGDAKHTSKCVQEWLGGNTPNFIAKDAWPTNSPDLNIIENVWSVMDTELRKRRVRTYNGLKRAIRKIWEENISLEYVRSLFDSIPCRFRAVEQVGGGHTKY